ncbi:MAG: hypothetical protein Greene041614_581 [Parcubacteria group bacterium Greene0416_14]|nr:MAG: hypothetical protein Greene041614_581 [Parcubacteria group bacterium Greene0416_14]TSD00597.1 MAG: hypothetical protein Greene101415_818 [Parcubacteria group bacterium Greene1014_15]
MCTFFKQRADANGCKWGDANGDKYHYCPVKNQITKPYFASP